MMQKIFLKKGQGMCLVFFTNLELISSVIIAEAGKKLKFGSDVNCASDFES